MYKDGDENGFDGLLKDAFCEYACNQADNEPTSEELEARYPIPEKELCAAKKLSKKAKRGKRLGFVYLQRAGIIALVCICALFTVIANSADEVDYLKITADLYRSLVEKVEHTFGKSSIIITSDYVRYTTLDELIANEDVSDVLLPSDCDGKYSFERISYDNFGDYSEISIYIKYNNERIGSFWIKTPYPNEFAPNKYIKIDRFDVIKSEYDGFYQFEFKYDDNAYLIKTTDYDMLLELTESLQYVE